MKYERLTEKAIGCFGYDLKDFEHKPKEFNDYDAFYAYKTAVGRLGELEDKIESRELVEVPKGAVVLTPEERAEEMRLANEELKNAVRECAASIKLAFYYEFDELIPSIMADKIDELVEECSKLDYIHERLDVIEDYKHRAEVAERAVQILANDSLDYTYDDAIEQAEKELAEEEKDGKMR